MAAVLGQRAVARFVPVDWFHNLGGFVAMGDGSVQHFNDKRLAEALRGTGMTTNRLAVP